MQRSRVVILVASVVVGLASALGPAPARADEAVAFVGATVYPVSSEPIADGAVVIREGLILAVGPRDQVELPEDVRIRELPGRVIIPGLVDTHSHIALSGRPLVAANRGTNESTNPVTPENSDHGQPT